MGQREFETVFDRAKKISAFWEKASYYFLDLLFPIACLDCGAYNEWLCEKCLSKIKIAEEQSCPSCEKTSTPDGRTCFVCKKNSPLDSLLICASYGEKMISKSVHIFKYRFVADLSVPLGKIMSEKIRSSSLPLPDYLVPVPLHPRRLRWRGFNQSSLLAREIGKNLCVGIEIPVSEEIIRRTRHTSAQMKIGGFKNRLKNVSGAFSISEPSSVKGKTFFLVDDIATTGATLFECAKILKENGAHEVFAVVLARQEMKARNR